MHDAEVIRTEFLTDNKYMVLDVKIPDDVSNVELANLFSSAGIDGTFGPLWVSSDVFN